MQIGALVPLVVLAACASTGVVPMDHGTYLISKRSPQLGFGPPVQVQADVYREANEFCAKDRKALETVKLDTTDSGFARPGSVSLQSKCVAPGDADKPPVPAH